MRRYEKATLIVLLVMTLAVAAIVILTHEWANYRERFRAAQLASQSSQRGVLPVSQRQSLVDTTALDTAQTLATLAVTRRERNSAQEALRLADYSVDLAFSIATQDAAAHPAPMTPEMKALADHVKTAREAVEADTALVNGLTAQMKDASPADKDRIQAALAIVQTQLSLDQDDAQDAEQQLIRAGGDKQAIIQQLIDQHNASESHADKTGEPAAAASIESTTLNNILSQARAYFSLRSKKQQLLQAQKEAQTRATNLGQSHVAMQKSMDDEKTQSQTSGSGDDGMSTLQHMSQDQKEMAAIAKRMDTEQQLAAVYGNWAEFVDARAKYFLHGIFVAVLWIFVILLMAWGVNFLIQRAFAKVAFERRQLHTFRAMVLVFVQAAAVLLVLLVIFGMPSNLGTILALTTAGFTVAMQDFILGFFGWFALMGRDGIRPGDWVEINGVSGEVIDVGVFHTVLLETGSGADSGHPTGRKVSFMNNYAIQGRYFNFSTSGQWMWDEIEVQVTDPEPYAKAEAIRKIVADATVDNVHVAESEWSRSAPYYVKKSLSAEPAMSIRPAGSGVTVAVRYITRATERYDVRAKIYREIVELLHNKRELGNASPAPPTGPAD